MIYDDSVALSGFGFIFCKLVCFFGKSCIRSSCYFLELLQCFTKHICLKNRISSLQHHQEAFKSHTGIYVFCWEFGKVSCTICIVCHKYVVPYFCIPVVFSKIPICWAIPLSSIIIELTTWSTRSYRPWRPEVVWFHIFVESHFFDMLNSHLLECGDTLAILRDSRLCISRKYCCSELFYGDTSPCRQKLYRPANTFCFEVISKWSISHHFKIRQMPFIPNIINIWRSDASLYIVESLPVRVCLTHKIWYKRLHSCYVEERRSIFRTIYDKRPRPRPVMFSLYGCLGLSKFIPYFTNICWSMHNCFLHNKLKSTGYTIVVLLLISFGGLLFCFFCDKALYHFM